MATIPAPRSRRRCGRSLDQVPLSSSEIELYSRHDEVTRRRRRLLAVRDEERRLAQHMTLRYRNNLRKLQHKKLQTFQKELSSEQQKMLNELYVHYQKSMQSTGTEQRNARLKLRKFMEQVQKAKNKWTFRCQIGGKGRTIEAHKAQEKAAVVTTARRRQVEQRRERLKVGNNQQERRSTAEVRHEKNDASWGENKKGKDEETKNRDEIDHERKREQLIVEAQQKKGLERGRKALDEIVLRRQGLQAMEWLALVDKMERRARGKELGGGEDYSLYAGDVDGGMDESERMAERAFAQMLGLDDNLAELSVFSINSDDARSVALDEQVEHKPGKPLKTTTLGNLQRGQLETLKKAEDMRKTGLRLGGVKDPQIRTSVQVVRQEHRRRHRRRIVKASSKASSTENVQSTTHLENECSKMMADERDSSLRSVSHSENEKESADLNTGQLGNNFGVGDRALLETPCSQWEWCTARGDQFISGTSGHRDKYGNAEEQSEGTNEVEEYCSTFHRLNVSPRSLARDEVNEEKVLEVTRNLGRQVSATGPVGASLVEGGKILSASSSSTSDADNHEFYEKGRVFDRTVVDDDERLSLSDSFSGPSQEFLSQIDQVANARIRSLKQLSVDQQIMAFSDSERLNEDDREAEAESHRPSIGTNSARSSANFSVRDLYCQQIHYKTRRSSTSAVSVAQYSLPSSNTQNLLNENLDRLCPGHDDSFVNELVPMFPKHTLPPPPRSLEEDNQTFEEYDTQLVAPDMNRMTSEQLPSFRSSQQRLIHQAAATDYPRRQPPASTTMPTERSRPSTPSDKSALSSLSSWRSSSDSSSCKLDATSFNTSVEQSPVQQHKATGQIQQVTAVVAEL
ncbi:unnamed protein product [Peronospora destructor]|uniref:Uncharacterized protein n=1 Tax=Peronospora destructor TaxID=86335 RepID=A0AAV0V5J9_9STRA|nr:unnamed protein product [Peronospora destructor]